MARLKEIAQCPYGLAKRGPTCAHETLHPWLRGFCLLLIALASCAWWPVPVFAQGGPGDLWQTFTNEDGLVSGNILAVFVAQDGTLWFGTEQGVNHYNGSWKESLTVKNGLPAGRVRAIAQTP